MDELKTPILITGSPRSGTTLLWKVVSSVPGLCGWYEPRYLWHTGHAYRASDRATATDAKPWVRRRIRSLFKRYQKRHGDHRVVEKTPENVLRIPFICEVFPEAKILYICRDGRATLRSALERYQTFRPYVFHRWNDLRAAANKLGLLPWWEWPAHLPRVVRGMKHSYITRKPVKLWGVRYPGWQRDRADGLKTSQIAARQWVVAVETALEDLKQLPSDRWLGLRYEEVVDDPIGSLRAILAFCEVSVPDDFYERVKRTVHARSVDRWKEELDRGTLEEAMPIMARTLSKLGYA